MNKAQFVELVQSIGELTTKKEAQRAIDAFVEAVTVALTKKDSVSLVGFGTFSTLDVAEKSGIVPGTDKTYTKAAHVAPKFKAGQTLKDNVSKASI